MKARMKIQMKKQTTINLLLFVAVSLFFFAFPQVDLFVTSLFYSPELGGFYLNDNAVVQVIYDAFKHMPKLLLPLMLLFLILGIKVAWFKARRKLTAFALITLLLGPGILVHTVFKDNWDRARPRAVEMFGGEKSFSRAWVISDQCERNCSFVSGHAAMGFYFMILGWLLHSRKWFYIGLAIGVAVGGIRVFQGGHFISDSILAGFMVYWTIWLGAKAMNIANPGEDKPELDSLIEGIAVEDRDVVNSEKISTQN
jgi:lipid A 4'-phosphatase